MACNCIAEMDALLAERNTKLNVSFVFPRDGSASFTLPLLDVEKIEKRKRVGPALAVPSFCPFCGVRYTAPAHNSTGAA